MVIGINDRSYNLVGGEVILLNLLTIGAKYIDMGSKDISKILFDGGVLTCLKPNTNNKRHREIFGFTLPLS